MLQEIGMPTTDNVEISESVTSKSVVAIVRVTVDGVKLSYTKAGLFPTYVQLSATGQSGQSTTKPYGVNVMRVPTRPRAEIIGYTRWGTPIIRWHKRWLVASLPAFGFDTQVTDSRGHLLGQAVSPLGPRGAIMPGSVNAIDTVIKGTNDCKVLLAPALN